MRRVSSSRRAFVKQTAGTALAASALSQLNVLPNAHAAGSDTLRIGLVGCGGRGTGAAAQALKADSNAKLVAMADAFQDRLDSSLEELKSSRDTSITARVDVPKDRQFAGFDAYKNVIDQVDVVLLTSTPHFRPMHFEYAVAKGVHSFVEKPVATDAAGVRAFLQSCEEAKKKSLSVVSGLCWRYFHPRREAIKRVHDGQIGNIVAIETTYNSQGVWEPRKTRDEVKSEMEYQMRNWYYYTWLGGDHIVEQAVHAIDTMAWALGDKPPIQCWGTGGRQSRIDPKYGNIYDHFALVYEYPNNVRGYHTCRHWKGTPTRLKDYIRGEKGFCDVFGSDGRHPSILDSTGKTKWRHRGSASNMYQNEHDELFASIRSGKPVNTATYAATSTLLAIMGRMAAYTGDVITWEMAMNSKESLAPAAYAWGDAPQHPVARPGVTKFV